MIYLDYNATTPVHPEVLNEMLPFLKESFANPSSRTHELGRNAERSVSQSRDRISSKLNIEPTNLIFTSGATEANNLVLLGLKKHLKDTGKTKIITTQFEHKSVLDPLSYLQNEEGFNIEYLSPNKEGYINPKDLRDLIDDHTGLISIMQVNNEIGTVQNITKLAEIAKEKEILFHSDGAQGFCKVDTKLSNLIDYYTMSGHKIYGPKGIGALAINGRKPKKYIRPITFGGGQEYGLRSGTLSPHLIVGFAKATEICDKLYSAKSLKNLAETSSKIIEELQSLPQFQLNLPIETLLPTTINFRFNDIKSEALLLRLKSLALSNGSACTAKDYAPSHVLKAIGLSDKEALESIRMTISPFEKVNPVNLVNEIKKIL